MGTAKKLDNLSLKDVRAYISVEEYERLKQLVEAQGIDPENISYSAAQSYERDAV